MDKMSSITFPDGSSYEVVDDTARAQLRKIQGLIGETLFEGSVSAGNTIEFDATKHSLFAVTVKFNEADEDIYGVYHLETTILCTREIQTGRGGADDWNAGSIDKCISGSAKFSHKQSAYVRINEETKVLKSIGYYADDKVAVPTSVTGVVTKIVGIV